MLYLDLKGYLGEGVLAKVDRASMACSLEVRVPLLDRRVVELAASLPIRLKLRGLTTKYVLKRTLAGCCRARFWRAQRRASASRWHAGSAPTWRPSSGTSARPTW